MPSVFLKFFLVHELKTLGIPWREETREKGDREGRDKGGRYGVMGVSRHVTFLGHILVRKLYLVKISLEN